MNFLPIIQRIVEAGGWIRAYPGGKIRYHVAGGLTTEELATIAASKPAILSALAVPMMIRLPDGTGRLANPLDVRLLCLELAKQTGFPTTAVLAGQSWQEFSSGASIPEIDCALMFFDDILQFTDLEVAA